MGQKALRSLESSHQMAWSWNASFDDGITCEQDPIHACSATPTVLPGTGAGSIMKQFDSHRLFSFLESFFNQWLRLSDKFVLDMAHPTNDQLDDQFICLSMVYTHCLTWPANH